MRADKKTFGTGTKRTTSAADLAGLEWANFNHINPFLYCFIADEVLQLKEVPAIQPEVESPALSHSSYSFKVLNHNSSCVAVIDDLFADYMVPVSLETSLPARDLFEQFPARTSAFALEPCSQSLEFKSIRSYFSSAKELPLACYCNMVYSYINTKKSVARSLDVYISGKCNVQEHSVMFINSNSHSLPIPIKILPVIFRNFNRNINPAFNSGQSHFVKAEIESPLVKVKRHKLFENRLASFVGFDGFEGLRSYPICIYDKLRRQIELVSCFIIAKMVKLVSVCNISLKSFISDIKDSFGVLFHSCKKQFIYRYPNLDCCNRFHTDFKTIKIYKSFPHLTSVTSGTKMSRGKWQLLSRMNSGVSPPHV